jgi:acetyltransferase-like isoleucine patch superfamily enzyme
MSEKMADNQIDVADGVFMAPYGLDVTGSDNTIRILAGSKLSAKIVVRGNRNKLSIGASCIIRGEIQILTSGAIVELGAKVTAMGLRVSMHEAETLRIGEDCMFSGGVWVDCSDIHSILDAATGQRINPPEPITIAPHVWVGRNVTILKGSHIGRDCVIGAGAVTTGAIPPQSIAAGVPAKVIRSGIIWDRKRLPWK